MTTVVCLLIPVNGGYMVQNNTEILKSDVSSDN